MARNAYTSRPGGPRRPDPRRSRQDRAERGFQPFPKSESPDPVESSIILQYGYTPQAIEEAAFEHIPPMFVTSVPGKDFRRAVRLEGDLIYRSKVLQAVVKVPKAFLSDGASVPQLFWNRYPPFGQYLEAAVVHDLFCELGHMGISPIDYKQAAKVFREAMAALGYSKWKRNVMYRAVKWFGPKFKAQQFPSSE